MGAMGVPVSGLYGTMMGLPHHFPLLFPSIASTSSSFPGEPSSPRLARQLDRGVLSKMVGKEILEEDDVMSVDSAEVDSVLRDLMSDHESTTLEADEDEGPPEVIPEDDDET